MRAYDRYAAPTPGRIMFQGGLENFTHDAAATTYDFANDGRAPLLFISGGSDHILPSGGAAGELRQERQALHGGHRAQGLRRP